MRSQIQRRRLGFEGLERRELLAGNVTAGLDVNGNVLITGDLEDNHVVVYKGFFGQILVEGGRSNGQASGITTVNGQTIAQAVSTTGGIVLNMSDGNDRVLITNLSLQGNITGSLGVGNDQLAVQSSAQGAVSFVMNDAGAVPYGKLGMSGLINVQGAAGSDTFSLYDATIGGDVTIAGQNGNDVFVQSGSTLNQNVIGGSVLLTPGNGNDSVSVRRLTVAGGFTLSDGSALTGTSVSLTNVRVNLDIRLNLSIRADSVVIQGEDNGANRFQARDVIINTGDGNDTVDVNRGIMTNLRIATGTGNEGGGFFGVELVNLAIGGVLFVDTGDGLDNVHVQNVTSDALRLFTGAQSDGVIAQNLDVRDAIFDTLDAVDIVGLYDSVFDLLKVRLGDGNDSLTAQDLNVSVQAIFDGGLGVNTYNDNGGNTFNQLIRKNI